MYKPDIPKLFIRRSFAVIVATVLLLSGFSILSGCSSTKGSVAGPVIDGVEGYHVIVAGGEPEGVAAALAAARNGMRTLLVEEGDALGGLFTLGMLNFLDMNHGPGGALLTRGIFEEFYEANGNAFDVEEAKKWFMQKCLDEPNITVLINTEIVAPVMTGNTIAGLEVRENNAQSTTIYRSLTVIDCTIDGDVAAAAGAPYTVGGEDYGAHGVKQGVTLVFEVADVNWNAVVDFLKNDGNPNTGADSVSAWGYSAQAREYIPQDANMRFRGPNFARQKTGSVLLNALIIFGVDALDPLSLAEGIARGQRELPYLVEFMRENFEGFENATLAGHAPRLYVRETRHFIGEYRLTITDVLENRDHWDRIGHGSYPVDLQPTGPDNTGNIIGVPDVYSIPFRCLLPLEVEQLLIASRSASYDSLPHGSARVVPIGMVAGEAAGTAVAYSVNNNVTFRQMANNPQAILWLQDQLVNQGAYLTEYDPPREDFMDHWAYPGLVVMRELGMAAGGYTNDYGLDNETPHRWALQNRTNTLMRIAHERTAHRGDHQIPPWEISINTDEITVGMILLAAAECASLGDRELPEANRTTPLSFNNAAEARDYLVNAGIIDATMLQHFQDLDAIAINGQLHSILGALFLFLVDN